jgi:hypothetical protein
MPDDSVFRDVVRIAIETVGCDLTVGSDGFQFGFTRRERHRTSAALLAPVGTDC